MDFHPFIEKFRKRFAEVEAQLSAPDAFANPQKGQELTREHSRLKELVSAGEEYLEVESELAANRQLVASEPTGSELAGMAQEEIQRLEMVERKLSARLKEGIIPPSPTDSRNSILEIRAAAGGAESALFAADLLRMYQRYSEAQGWRFEILDSSSSDLGGYRDVVCSVTGQDVYKRMKYESGVHRVQRVPATEAQGRIHTSTVTVAVLPEAQEVDVVIKPEDLEINVCRAGGHGGQGGQHHRFRRHGGSQTIRIGGPMPGRAVPAQEQGKGADGAPVPSAGTEGGGGTRQVRRRPQGAGRHRGAQREEPHL